MSWAAGLPGGIGVKSKLRRLQDEVKSRKDTVAALHKVMGEGGWRSTRAEQGIAPQHLASQPPHRASLTSRSTHQPWSPPCPFIHPVLNLRLSF